jgi:hypothetical protein
VLKRWFFAKKSQKSAVIHPLAMRPSPRFPFSRITSMRTNAGRRRLWTRIAAGVFTLLALVIVLLASYDPRPAVTRATIDAMQWALQGQSVR